MGTDFTAAEIEAAINVLINDAGEEECPAWEGWGEWEVATRNPNFDPNKQATWREGPSGNDHYIWSPVVLTLRGEKFAVTEIEQHGGEGQGDHCSCTFQVGTQLFTKHGYYASYDGHYWDGDLVEVHPVQKTITVYEKI